MNALDGLPRLLLRLDGVAELACSLALYFDQDFGWRAQVDPTAFRDTHLQRV